MRHISRLTQSYTITIVVMTILGLSACDQAGPHPNDADLATLDDDEDIDDLIDEDQPPTPNSMPAPAGDLAVETRDPTPITGSSKICSVYTPNEWRDTILLNNVHNWGHCNNFRASVGASTFQIGCLTDASGVNWGIPNSAAAPWPNCGW